MRIIRNSEKYNIRPSEVLGLSYDTWLSLCFDEAVDFILSMKRKKEVKKEDGIYLEEYWVKEPNWIDKKIDVKKKQPNNSALISEMKETLSKFNSK